MKKPLTLSRGQYLQEDVLLHDLVSTRLDGVSALVLEPVEARSMDNRNGTRKRNAGYTDYRALSRGV